MLVFRLLLFSSINVMGLCCYGDDYSYEIKLLLKDVVAQLKKQNKRTESALSYLDRQNEQLGDVLIQLDFQRRKAENVVELLHKQDIKVVTMLETLQNFKPPVIIKAPPPPPTKSIPIYRPETHDRNYGRTGHGNRGPPAPYYPEFSEDYDSEYTDSPSGRYPDSHPSGYTNPPRRYTDPPHRYTEPPRIYTDPPPLPYTDPPKRFDKSTTSTTDVHKSTNPTTPPYFYHGPATTTSTPLPVIRAGELKVKVPHELIGAKLQKSIEMECYVENTGSQPILFWRFNGTALPTISLKYRRRIEYDYPGPKKMIMRVLDLHPDDGGFYDCVVDDAGDTAFGTIRVYILNTII